MAGTPPFEHRPVMVDRVVDLLGPVPPGVVIDATVGGGGHSAAVLEAHPHLSVIGIDRDQEAVAAARERLAPFGDRAHVVHARFDDLSRVVEEHGHELISGAIFDLGVSSPQLDTAERGFSYRRDGPLDMRMDRGTSPSAADLVNQLPEDELADLLRRLGDERYDRRVARAIVAARPLHRTGELADVIRSAIPAARRGGRDPARRTFQALRIAVNDELAVLPGALDTAIERLVPGGRVLALAYHSGEDRIVKERFRHAASGGCVCPPGLPCVCGAVPTVRLLKAGAWKSDATEVAENRRAESARLRAVERLPGGDAA
jgi:16S rRNA (cytosine1402-N4)-methyltransferase